MPEHSTNADREDTRAQTNLVLFLPRRYDWKSAGRPENGDLEGKRYALPPCSAHIGPPVKVQPSDRGAAGRECSL